MNGEIYLVTNSVPLPGDYNHDRVVDAADYLVWRKTVGQSGYLLDADGDGNGTVNSLDYTVWRGHLGQIWSAAGSGLDGSQSASIPEPMTAGMLFIGIGAGYFCRRRKFS